MFRNHFVSAIRNLTKHKGFTLIHVGGLAIGLTAGLFVIHYARLEYSYENFHQNAERTYRVTTQRYRDGVPITHFASTFAGSGPALKADFAEIESYTRLFRRYRGGIISYENTHLRENNIWHADSGFFDVFSFPIVQGSATDLFKPGSAFIEEKLVAKYFGNEDPIGKRIRFGSMNGIEDYEIKGVLRCPENSSIKFNFVFNYHDLGRIYGTDHVSNFRWLDFHTFITLKENADISHLESQLDDFIKRYRSNPAIAWALQLQPLMSIYLNSKTEFETGITGNKTTVQVLLALGIIIIVIVVLNFINLSSSRSLTRAKEVGIRKVLGSSRQSLISQFMIETGVINFVACCTSILLVVLLLPSFNNLTQRILSFSAFMIDDLWKYLSLFLLTGTFFMGLYPAILLSSFKAIDVLKGFFSPKRHGAFLREIFVSFQAVVSFSLVASILIILDQVDFISKIDLGIDINKTLVVRTPDVVTGEQYTSSLASYKDAMLQDSRVTSVAMIVDSPGAQVEWISGTRRLSANPTESFSLHRSVVDEDFLSAFNLNLLAGKMFSPNQFNGDILVNESLTKALGYNSNEESIGQQLLVGRDTFNIIGVLEDFHQVSPREAITPTVYHYKLEPPKIFVIKFTSNQPKDILQLAQENFAKTFPAIPFDYYFLDDFYSQQYNNERKLTSLISVFCILAVIVSGLGLLGLTWFRMARQKKELAIRKIVGSTDLQLFANASRKLFINTVAGCIVGVPLTWFIMTRWLETFTYHTHPKLWEFGIAAICSLLIALVSISGHTLKVIKANPVNHLRQE